jgi:hypothetical protein
MSSPYFLNLGATTDRAGAFDAERKLDIHKKTVMLILAPKVSLRQQITELKSS